MSTFVGLGNRIYVGPLDLSGLANNVSFGPIQRVMVPCTTYNDGGFECFKPGLLSGAGSVSGFQDFAADTLDSDISIGALGTQYAFTVYPSATGTVAAGDPAWTTRGVVNDVNPLDGAKGDMAGFMLGQAFDTGIVQGKVLAPLAAVTTTTNGTAVALAGPTASQSLYAALHVTAYSGLTNVVFTVETDDNSSFTSATTRLTFTTVSGRTSEWKSVAGAFASETHVRVVATVTGTGSCTFTCAAGVV